MSYNNKRRFNNQMTLDDNIEMLNFSKNNVRFYYEEIFWAFSKDRKNINKLNIITTDDQSAVIKGESKNFKINEFNLVEQYIRRNNVKDAIKYYLVLKSQRYQKFIVFTIDDIENSYRKNTKKLLINFNSLSCDNIQNSKIFTYDIDQNYKIANEINNTNENLISYLNYYEQLYIDIINKEETDFLELDINLYRQEYIFFKECEVGSKIILPVTGNVQKIKSLFVRIEGTVKDDLVLDVQLDIVSKNDIFETVDSFENIEFDRKVKFAELDLSELSKSEIIKFNDTLLNANNERVVFMNNNIGEKTRINRIINAIKKSIQKDVINYELIKNITNLNYSKDISEFYFNKNYSVLNAFDKYKLTYPQLNEEQIDCVNKVLMMERESIDLFLIQGPPGTGKTELILALMDILKQNGKNVLISSNVHVACDNIIERVNIFSDSIVKRYKNIKGPKFDAEKYENQKRYVNNQIKKIFEDDDEILLTCDDSKKLEQKIITNEELLGNYKKELLRIEKEIANYFEIIKKTDNSGLVSNNIELEYAKLNRHKNTKYLENIREDKATFDFCKDKNNKYLNECYESIKPLKNEIYDLNSIIIMERKDLIKKEKDKKVFDNLIKDNILKIDTIKSNLKALDDFKMQIIDSSNIDLIKNDIINHYYKNDEKLQILNEVTIKLNIIYIGFQFIDIVNNIKNELRKKEVNDDDLFIDELIDNIASLLKFKTYLPRKIEQSCNEITENYKCYEIERVNAGFFSSFKIKKLRKKLLNYIHYLLNYITENYKFIIGQFLTNYLNDNLRFIKSIQDKINTLELEIEKIEIKKVELNNDLRKINEEIKLLNGNIRSWEIQRREVDKQLAQKELELKVEDVERKNGLVTFVSHIDEIIKDKICKENLIIESIIEYFEKDNEKLIADLYENKLLLNNINNSEMQSKVELYYNLRADLRDLEITVEQQKKKMIVFNDRISILKDADWSNLEIDNLYTNYYNDLNAITSEDEPSKGSHNFKGLGYTFDFAFEVCNYSGISSMTTNQIAPFIDSGDVEFDYAIIDEASKCKFEDLIVALPKIKKLILIGDFMQLSPVFDDYNEQSDNIKNLLSKKQWQDLNSSSFYSLLKVFVNFNFSNNIKSFKQNKCVSILKKQYRMNKEIFNLIRPIYSIYQGFELQDEKNIDQNSIRVINVNGNERKSGTSRINDDEVAAVFDIIRLIKDNAEYNKIKSIGIITGYRAQEKEIYKNLRQLKVNSLNIEIGTFDRFQGREYDLVIISMTITNDLGFLSEIRRMNVALSRAKRKLIILGNFDEIGKMRKNDNSLLIDQNSKELLCVKHYLIPELTRKSINYSSQKDFLEKIAIFLEDSINE